MYLQREKHKERETDRLQESKIIDRSKEKQRETECVQRDTSIFAKGKTGKERKNESKLIDKNTHTHTQIERKNRKKNTEREREREREPAFASQ